jgi:predicted RNase H-like nuclease (RuvC/YqgF family)
MELKPAIKAAARPAAKLATWVVTRAVGSRLAALEAAAASQGEIGAKVQALAAEVQALAADVQALKAYLPAVLDAVSSQHAITRAAVRAEQRARQAAERVEQLERLLDDAPEMPIPSPAG